MGTARQAREQRRRERGVVLMLSFFVIIILIAVVGVMFAESQADSGIAQSREGALQLEAAEAGAFHYEQALLLADLAQANELAAGEEQTEVAAITSLRRAQRGDRNRDTLDAPAPGSEKSGEKRRFLADRSHDLRFSPMRAARRPVTLRIA